MFMCIPPCVFRICKTFAGSPPPGVIFAGLILFAKPKICCVSVGGVASAPRMEPTVMCYPHRERES